ncbi:MAG: hypothetical protein HDS70_06625 [Bacteroidales bacterium]|nr:hypothetical protein [Bacteroidales bacterium]MBD5222019.1 hypothetical protein [Bacteroidales bacterium]
MTPTLQEMTSDQSLITPALAAELARKYPYFVYPTVVLLRGDREVADRSALRRRVAAHIGDTDTLLNLFEEYGDVFADFYPDMHEPNPSTEDTIDNFLNKFGSGATIGPDPLDFAPAVDYAAILEAEERGEALPGDIAVADESHKETRRADNVADREKKAPEASSEPTPLTESLAVMMIKNGNYVKALEIINDLNLRNPEKSVYFADQIRFLRKLIINQKNK